MPKIIINKAKLPLCKEKLTEYVSKHLYSGVSKHRFKDVINTLTRNDTTQAKNIMIRLKEMNPNYNNCLSIDVIVDTIIDVCVMPIKEGDYVKMKHYV